MRSFARSTLVILVTLIASPALAQTEEAAASGPPPVEVRGAVGVSAANGIAGPVFGGAFTVDLTPHLAFELGAAFLDRGRAAGALAGTANLVFRTPVSNTHIQPYVLGGGGVYHARFDLGAPALFGGVMGRPGSAIRAMMPIGGGGFGPYGAYGPNEPLRYHFDEIPNFYANRFGMVEMPASGRLGTRTFTDPALSVGGGIRLEVNRRLILYPELRALVVMAEGDAYTVTTVSMGVGYRF